MMPGDLAVAVFASRETSQQLQTALHSGIASAEGSDAEALRVDVLVNGNSALAHALAGAVADAGAGSFGRRTTLRVFDLCVGDKAATWNRYVHVLAQPAEAHVFMDGYVQPAPDAIARLLAALRREPGALASTGAPSVGRHAAAVARQMAADGGLHGNLHILRGSTLQALRSGGIRLPVGLYRTDSVLGSMLAYGLDLFPERQWRLKERVVLVPDAGWRIETLRWWHPADWRVHARRRSRQDQGVLENAAVRDQFTLRRLPLNSLPATVNDLIRAWAERAPDDAQRLLRANRRLREVFTRLQRPSLHNPSSGRQAAADDVPLVERPAPGCGSGARS